MLDDIVFTSSGVAHPILEIALGTLNSPIDILFQEQLMSEWTLTAGPAFYPRESISFIVV